MSRLCAAALILAGLLARPAWAHDTVYYYSSDAQGSEVVITDVNRNVVERTYYGPYGEVLNRPLREGPGYTGHEEDAATGLDNMQQRYYDPSARRFPSVDPMPVDTTTGANFNRYAYANDNPYRYVDPDGRNANGRESPGERHDKDVQQAEDGSIEKRFPGEASGITGISLGAVSAAESANSSKTTARNENGQPIIDANTGQPLSKPSYARLGNDIKFGESIRDENPITKFQIMKLWFSADGIMDYQRDGLAFNPQWRDYTNFTFGAVSAAAGYSAFFSLYVGGAGYNLGFGKIRAGFLGTPDSNWMMWVQGRQYYLDSTHGGGGR